MKYKNEHFRHILLFYFHKGKNAAQAAKKLCDLYSEEALKDRQCQNWFIKFRSGDFSLKDEQRSGRPNEPPQTTSKAELHQKKIMLSFWWDWKGVVFFELISRNKTINLDVYCC